MPVVAGSTTDNCGVLRSTRSTKECMADAEYLRVCGLLWGTSELGGVPGNVVEYAEYAEYHGEYGSPWSSQSIVNSCGALRRTTDHVECADHEEYAKYAESLGVLWNVSE